MMNSFIYFKIERKIYKRIIIIILIFLFVVQNIFASAGDALNHRIYEQDKNYQLVEELFISSGELNPSIDFLITYNDAIELIESWKIRHRKITKRQLNILNELEKNFSQSGNGKTDISINIGFDVLAHSVPDCTSNDYYNKFKEQDFVTKYEDRGGLLDIKFNYSMNEYFYISTHTLVKNDWKKLNSNSVDYIREIKDINVTVNKKGFALFRMSPLTIVAGRDKVSLGIGENDKLLVSNHLPTMDNLHVNIRLKDKIAFNSYTATIKPKMSLNDMQKIIYAHRLNIRLFNKLSLSLTELLVTNQSVRLSYFNPFIYYHNDEDFSDTRNVMTLVDAEYVPYKNVKFYTSILIDEIDVALFESSAESYRKANGIHFGMKIFTPFKI